MFKILYNCCVTAKGRLEEKGIGHGMWVGQTAISPSLSLSSHYHHWEYLFFMSKLKWNKATLKPFWV
jgi:hypothetical protein